MKDNKNFDGLDISKISPEGLIGRPSADGAPLVETDLPPWGFAPKGNEQFRDGDEGIWPEDFSEIFQAAIKNIINAGSQFKAISGQEENFKNGGDIFLDLAVSRREAERGGYIPLEYQRYILCSQCDEIVKRAETGPCPKCEGIGRVMAYRRVEIKVPKDSKEGVVLKVANEGHVPSGDLFVKIVIRNED